MDCYFPFTAVAATLFVLVQICQAGPPQSKLTLKAGIVEHGTVMYNKFRASFTVPSSASYVQMTVLQRGEQRPELKFHLHVRTAAHGRFANVLGRYNTTCSPRRCRQTLQRNAGKAYSGGGDDGDSDSSQDFLETNERRRRRQASSEKPILYCFCTRKAPLAQFLRGRTLKLTIRGIGNFDVIGISTSEKTNAAGLKGTKQRVTTADRVGNAPAPPQRTEHGNSRSANRSPVH